MGKRRTVTKEGKKEEGLAIDPIEGHFDKLVLHIHSTYNNTIITLSKSNGDTITSVSAGMLGFEGPRKSTPYAAGKLTKALLRRMRGAKPDRVEVFVKGIGPGRESALRGLTEAGFEIDLIKDKTPVPHNGPRPPKPRRV